MFKQAAFGLAGLSATGLGLYLSRRQWLAQMLGLSPVQNAVGVEYGLRARMRDGAHLVADHYYPLASGRFPTILMRTPYGRGIRSMPLGWLISFSAQRFAERGYHVVIQDTRGRFDSEGEFAPFFCEAEDGQDTLNWLADQPWFNGVAGMWGLSYGGYAQWAVAADAPAFLRSMVTGIAGSRMNQFEGGTFALNTIARWIYSLNTTGQAPPSSWWEWVRRTSLWVREETFTPAFSHLPLLECDRVMLGRAVPYYREWLNHPNGDDEYWDRANHSRNLAQVRVPTHLISGWYDMLLHETLRDYGALHAAGHAPYLTIGPWGHGNLELVFESLRQGGAYFEAYLKGDCSRLRLNPVRLYVMGADEWREFLNWPPSSIKTRYFLRAGRQLLADPPQNEEQPDRYRYDPADPTPSVGGQQFGPWAGPKDNRALEARSDVLSFTSSALRNPLEVIGPVRVELAARSSLPHTDFFARLCDVSPDGRSINLCDGLFRIRPGPQQGKRVGEDQVNFLEVHLYPTAYRFLPGHRIRLQVSSGAHPNWARNLGTGEPLGSATRMQAAEQCILHDPLHPSALVLPVVR